MIPMSVSAIPALSASTRTNFTPCRAKTLTTLTSFPSGETLALVGMTLRGAAMNGRLISAVASAGMSFGLIALSACTVLAANALEPGRDNSAVSQTSERDASAGADTSKFELKPDSGSNTIRISGDPGPLKVRYDDARDLAKGRPSGRLSSSHVRRSCVVVAPTAGRLPVTTRGPARMALVLGVAF